MVKKIPIPVISMVPPPQSPLGRATTDSNVIESSGESENIPEEPATVNHVDELLNGNDESRTNKVLDESEGHSPASIVQGISQIEINKDIPYETTVENADTCDGAAFSLIDLNLQSGSVQVQGSTPKKVAALLPVENVPYTSYSSSDEEDMEFFDANEYHEITAEEILLSSGTHVPNQLINASTSPPKEIIAEAP